MSETKKVFYPRDEGEDIPAFTVKVTDNGADELVVTLLDEGNSEIDTVPVTIDGRKKRKSFTFELFELTEGGYNFIILNDLGNRVEAVHGFINDDAKLEITDQLSLGISGRIGSTDFLVFPDSYFMTTKDTGRSQLYITLWCVDDDNKLFSNSSVQIPVEEGEADDGLQFVMDVTDGDNYRFSVIGQEDETFVVEGYINQHDKIEVDEDETNVETEEVIVETIVEEDIYIGGYDPYWGGYYYW